MRPLADGRVIQVRQILSLIKATELFARQCGSRRTSAVSQSRYQKAPRFHGYMSRKMRTRYRVLWGKQNGSLSRMGVTGSSPRARSTLDCSRQTGLLSHRNYANQQ